MTVVINGTTGIDTGTGSLIAADATTPTYLDLFEDTDNGSNYVRLIAPTSVASNRTITLPDATGTAVVGSAAVSAVGQIPFSTDGSSYTPTAKIVSGTVNAGGTNPFPSSNGPATVDFTGIPSWVKRITVMLSGISTNGTSNYQIQIGTSSGVETSGYLGSTWLANTNNTGYSTGFLVATGVDATTVFHCVASLTLVNAATNLWMFSMVGGRVSATGVIGGGSKTTASVLDRVRITTVNGTDLFDAGTINIMWE